MAKSPEAFRTISEVSEWLGVPPHVLRFWETRFTQVKPVKRAGGRRYYRPADMALLGGIRKLLHDDGLTIRGVQKLLREKGVRHVAELSPSATEQQAEEAMADGPQYNGQDPELAEPALDAELPKAGGENGTPAAMEPPAASPAPAPDRRGSVADGFAMAVLLRKRGRSLEPAERDDLLQIRERWRALRRRAEP